MVGVATALMRILFVVVAAAATAALIESKVVQQQQQQQQQQQWEGALLLLLKLAALSAAVNLSSVSTGGALIHHFANFRTPALSVSQIPTGLLLNTYIHTFKNCCQLFWFYAPWLLPNRAELRGTAQLDCFSGYVNSFSLTIKFGCLDFVVFVFRMSLSIVCSITDYKKTLQLTICFIPFTRRTTHK